MKSTRALCNAIEVELEVARRRWGESGAERNCLTGRRGELMAELLLLRHLRYFNRHGAGYAEVIKQVPRLRLWDLFLLTVPNLTTGRRPDSEPGRHGGLGPKGPRVAVVSHAY